MPSFRSPSSPRIRCTCSRGEGLYDFVHEGLMQRINGLEPADMWTQSVTLTTVSRVERAITAAAADVVAAPNAKK